MTITWINCAKRMPPVGKCIIKQPGISPCVGYIKPDTDAYSLLINNAEWTPYTEEAWEELNR